MKSHLLAVCALLAGCASTTAAKAPHHMSAARHEAMASDEQAQAAEHEAQYNRAAMRRSEHCSGGAGSDRFEDGGCWTSVMNPNAAQLREASEHRKRAAEHRAMSQALRDAEARACIGISQHDRDMSPFAHREDIARVETLMSKGSKTERPKLLGAVVVFRAVPGMTAQYLQRVVDCHLARNGALGHDVPEMAYCPLVPRDVVANVSQERDGFAIAMTSDDPEIAREIERRAMALNP